MAHAPNYYHVLDLAPPSRTPTKTKLSGTDVRRAYKLALLAAHPDKQQRAVPTDGKARTRAGYSVDEVKQAYTVLASESSRADYDARLLRQDDASPFAAHAASADFLLGLEVVDLGEFDVIEHAEPAAFSSSSSSCSSSTSNPNPNPSSSDSDPSSDEEQHSSDTVEWTRACRCGADKGFRIRETELEDAAARGDTEVLVGCEGCSLWVRVGFEVEEEEEEKR